VITKDVLDQGVNGLEDNKSSVNWFDDIGFECDDGDVFGMKKQRVQDTVYYIYETVYQDTKQTTGWDRGEECVG